MGQESLKVDASHRDALAWCVKCPSFREIRNTPAEAWQIALRHAQSVHPDDDTSQTAQNAYRHR